MEQIAQPPLTPSVCPNVANHAVDAPLSKQQYKLDIVVYGDPTASRAVHLRYALANNLVNVVEADVIHQTYRADVSNVCSGGKEVSRVNYLFA
jgi:hypothetical protein